MRKLILILTALVAPYVLAAQTPQDSVAAVDSVVPEKKPGLIKRIIDYFDESNKKPIGRKMDFSLIGGPYYSSDSKFGIGLVAAGLYNTFPEDTLTKPSNISLSFKATTAAHFELGVSGEHIFPHDRYRLTYEVSFSSIRTRYWGVGYDMCSNDNNESKYRYLASSAEAHFAWRIGRNIYLGPMMTFNYVNAGDLQKPELWEGDPLRTFNYGIGASFRFDTRDNLTAPKHGVFVRFDQSFDFKWMGNKYPFKVNELTAAWYGPLWKGATLATQLHWRVTWGDTPWALMSSIGGSSSMRGYFEGRYRDKGEADICVELRQHVWRRNGVVAWVGAASLFPKLSEINFHEILPNFGFGYRWEFKKNVNVRVDVGFGKHQSGFFFNINEAF